MDPAQTPSLGDPPQRRVLLQNADGAVHLEGELRLVAACSGDEVNLVVWRVSTFAFVVATIVGTLALARVAPRPVGIFAAMWIAAAVGARTWAARRRREHGRFVLDLDAGRVHAVTAAATVEFALDEQVVIELTDQGEPDDLPRWLILRRGGDRYRLARGLPEELRPVLYVLRRQGVRAPLL